METGVVVDWRGQPIYWHVPPGRSAGSLPDSRDLWAVLWENRDRVMGFAHSHPGAGDPGPSGTDITTFEAVEKAMGRKLAWWIITEDRVGLCYQARLSRDEPPEGLWRVQILPENQAWLGELRRLSYGNEVK